MLFNLNEFLMAVSFALDFVEMDVLGVPSNHGKRTAYISLSIAKKLGLSVEELHDAVALAIMHDNGISEKSLHDLFITEPSKSKFSIERIKEHCDIGEENVLQYPFITNTKGVIRYHHERYDGAGFYGLTGDETPLLAQIIHLADVMENSFDMQRIETRELLGAFLEGQRNIMFSDKLITTMLEIIQKDTFWNDIQNEHIDQYLVINTPEFSRDLTLEEIRKVTGIFSKIVDAKSKFTQRHSHDLSVKTGIMAEYYNKGYTEKMKLLIAADLHDIGKLAVPNTVLDSTSKLTTEEFDIIKKHTYYTRLALQQIKGFEEITEWAANHHEKLNGKGYPFGKQAEKLDFNSRLMCCLDIYQALTEERPYRRELSHREAMALLEKMVEDYLVDREIVQDIDRVFAH